MNISPAKIIILPVILIAVGILLALFSAEIILRYIYPQTLYSFEKGLFVDSAEYGYCFAPLVEKIHSQPEYSYIIKTNSYGFRGKEPNFNAHFKVLVLGDSCGMGQGVKEGENLTDLAQIYFDKEKMDIDIFNTSVSGYSTINELKVLNKFIGSYKPNLVILIFNWNDLRSRQSLIVQNGYLVIRAGNKFTAPLREWLNNHSHLYCLIKRLYYIKKMSRPIKRVIGRSFHEADIKNSLDSLLEMKQISERNNAKFVVILIPVDIVHEQFDAGKENKKILIEQLRNNSIFFKDWSLVLPKEDKASLVYKLDRHWTKKGHEYFSKYLIDLIRTERTD